MKNEYSVDLFIIKPGVPKKMKSTIINKIKRSGFIIAIEKDALFSLDDMRKFYSKNNEDLIKIGESTINFFKENNIDIKKHFSKTTPLAVGKEIMERQAKYMASGKSTILITMSKNKNSNKKAKEIVGATFPEKANKGAIRSMSKDTFRSATLQDRSVHNLIHSSDEENINREIGIIKKYLERQ